MKTHTPIFSLKWRSFASIALIVLVSYYRDIKNLNHRVYEIEETNICGDNKSSSVLFQTAQNGQPLETVTSSSEKSTSDVVIEKSIKTIIHQPQYEPYLRKEKNKAIALGESEHSKINKQNQASVSSPVDTIAMN